MGGNRGILTRRHRIEEQEATLRVDSKGGIGAEMEGQLLCRETIGLCNQGKLVAEGEDRLLAPGDRPKAQRREPGRVHPGRASHQDQNGKGGGSLKSAKPSSCLDLHIGGFPRAADSIAGIPRGEDPARPLSVLRIGNRARPS